MPGLEDVYGPPCRTQEFVTVEVYGKRIPFIRGGANQLLRACISAYGVPYDVYRIESYNCRNVTGGTSKSAHSWAAAVDVNPEKNPFTSDGRLITDMPKTFVDCFIEQGFGWGGNWRKSKDAMHFSLKPNEGGKPRNEAFDPALQQRAIDAWNQRLAGGAAPSNQPPREVQPASTAPAYPGYVMDRARWEAGGKQADGNVQAFQQRLKERGWKIDADGKFGPGTQTVVTAFQREKGLDPDGRVGPRTWEAIWNTPVTR